MNPQLSIPKCEVAEFCQAHGIRRFAIFGSALRADFNSESDIDVLVEFVTGSLAGSAGYSRKWKSSFLQCSAAAR